MASFLVYIPGVTGASLDHLSRVGLGGLLDPHVSPDCTDMLRHTPDGTQGVVFYWIDHLNPINTPFHLGNHADIDWSPAKPKGDLQAGRFYLGLCKGQRVTPDALLRTGNLGGAEVTLEDGQQWKIPTAKLLPKKYTIDEVSGAPVCRVATKYQQYFDLSYRNYLAIMRQDPSHDVSVTGAWDFAEMALNWNYRITADVIDWLELIGDASMLYLLAAAYDSALIEAIEAQKKTA